MILSRALATNFEKFYFSPNFRLNFRITRFGEIGIRTKSNRQKQNGGGKHLPPPPPPVLKGLRFGVIAVEELQLKPTSVADTLYGRHLLLADTFPRTDWFGLRFS